MDYSQLADGLYQGGAVDRLPPGIDLIIDLQCEREDILPADRVRWFAWLPLGDHVFPGIDWLHAAVELIHLARKHDWSVLVHCSRGISRSSLVTVAYFMYSRRLSRDAALALVRSKRPQASPSIVHMLGLRDYELFLEEIGHGASKEEDTFTL